MNKKKEVPAEMIAQVAELNGWIQAPHGVIVQPYWHEGDMGEYWKFRIVHNTTGEVVVESLNPEHAEGHTYLMFMQALNKQYQKGFVNGLASAAKKVYESVCDRLGIRSESFQVKGLNHESSE